MNVYLKMIGSSLLFMLTTGVEAQTESTNYEYFFQTQYVPDETTVQIALVSHESPRWDEYKDLDTGSDSICISIFENDLRCIDSHDVDQGSYPEDPSIGWLYYTVKVLNSGKSAYFYLEAEGQDFQGDIYFTYDWREDHFYTGGNCGTAGTTYLANGTTIITHLDDEVGNNQFQPTNPSNLSISVYNNHPKLDWDASEYPPFTTKKYLVQRKPAGGSWSTIASNLSSNSYTDGAVWTNITKDRIRYYYRVQAYTTFPKYSPGYST